FISCIYENKECLLDYFDADSTVLFMNESLRINERQKVSEQIITETVIDLVEKGYIDGKNAYYSATLEDFNIFRTKFKTVICDMFVSGLDINLAGLFSFTTRQSPHISEGFNILKDDLENFASSGYKIIVFLNSDAGIKSLADTLSDFEIKYISVDINRYKDINDLPGGYAVIIKTPKLLNSANLCDIRGFELPKQKFALITDSLSDKRVETLKKRSIYNQGGKKSQQSSRQKIMSYTDLTAGDYVVHSNYGIGIFMGIERLDVSGGVQKDFIKIKYDGSDILYVPCNQLDLVSKYIGARSEDSSVKLSKMGGSNWQKAKSRAKSAAKDIANELIKLYAARQLKKGYAFQSDTEWQKDFESLFEYTETEDQLVCAEQIKTDMQQPVPMDRLLCGDVGFGKTEVALRAVFKCVSESKQAAILVPTTILAWQHYQTILSRFREFPVKIDMLSRFRSKKEQIEILKKLKSGEVDIIIGTHRIIQNDVKFKDLGLLIVDEEQRFGVAHKEKIKQVAEDIDVLTLTATPIPRTLNMALSGIRDMSVIEEAPHDRIPVQTYIFEYDDNIISEAIKNEIRRGGQVFYLHNRVETIEQTALKIKELCKNESSINIEDGSENEIKIGIAHGQMDEESLSKVWQSMLQGETDILVCTTIIESGIDIPDANTLIVEDADRLGLAQLHQIRGRVGRSSRRAYAYLTYPKNKVITEIAAKRLKAIREYTEFGAGFKIAMRDLEIRGAGNLLGSQQHGAMEGVGYDLYVKILEKAVNDQKKKLDQRKKLGFTDEDILQKLEEENTGTDDAYAADISAGIPTVRSKKYNVDIKRKETPGMPEVPVSDDLNYDAIENIESPEELEPTECLIDIAVDAFIPSRYMESEILRIEIYKRIAAIESQADADDLKDELTDRFGNIPKATGNLIDIALIRNSACTEYIDTIENKDKKAVIIYSDILSKPYGQKMLEKWTIAASKMNGRLLLSMGQKPHITYFLKSGEDIIETLKLIMNVLGEIKI
ncbi:MAG: transcription-repair coupling factor, partial [Oscillospiraceae bacterium]|nr:transcription-repair coupling factor [Oscillospiraceae bacterium]